MKGEWLPLGVGLLLCVTVLVAVAVLVNFTERAYLKPSESIQILTLVVLVAVTFWYAMSTHRLNRSSDEQAQTGRQALQVALDAEMNTVLPIVAIELQSISNVVGFSYSNIGRGPAIDLNIWLETPSEPSRFERSAGFEISAILGTGVKREDFEPFPEGVEYTTSFSPPLDIIAEYTDIFGRRFRSILRSYDHAKQEFSFQRISDNI